MGACRRISATYAVHRFIADPPATVIIGDLPRDEVEACIIASFRVVADHADDHRLTRLSLGDRVIWLGWRDGIFVWHEDVERVLDVLETVDRIGHASPMARLLVHLPSERWGLATTADFSKAMFGVPSVGYIALDYELSPDLSSRLIFADPQQAEAMVVAMAGLVEKAWNLEPAQIPGQDMQYIFYMHLTAKRFGRVVHINLTGARDHTGFVDFAKLLGVATRPK